jgi:two-component system NtrC family sensor kinase
MVVKQRSGMMEIWQQLRSNINNFVGFGGLLVVIVITVACTYGVNKLYLTEHTRAETMVLMEQNNQMASIGQLAAGVAHEINNPLALINETAGYVKDMFTIKKRYQQDTELIELIDTILDAIERCATITSQLLGFSRKFDIHTEKVDLRSVIEDVLVFHKKEAEYRNVLITVDIPEETPRVQTDRGKLQQIIMNLVNNAFHAVSDGCQIAISASPLGTDRVCLTIEDGGCGIPADSLDRIFEPFFTTKEKGRGTGLGLPITYGLVQRLHGAITVDSKENEGTTFTVSLPVCMQEELNDDESTAGG